MTHRGVHMTLHHVVHSTPQEEAGHRLEEARAAAELAAMHEQLADEGATAAGQGATPRHSTVAAASQPEAVRKALGCL